MNGNRLMYLDRGDTLHVIDPEALTHTDGLLPLLKLAVAVINAGYAGVRVDEQRMSNGRYFQALNLDSASPEGKIFQRLGEVHAARVSLPSAPAVLKLIAIAAGQEGYK